jgi:subtilisin family serine protease
MPPAFVDRCDNQFAYWKSLLNGTQSGEGAMTLRTLLFVCLYIGASFTTVHADPSKVKREGRPIPGAWIVLLNDDIGDETGYILDDIVKKHKVKKTSEFEPLLKGGGFQFTEAQAQAVARDPRVKEVWEQTEVELAATVTARSWNVDRIDQRVDPRLNGTYSYCSSGRRVRAYVVDTGIWAAHDEFANPDPVSGGHRVPLGFDYVQLATPTTANRSNNPPCSHSPFNETDYFNGGHGTAVASILGGRTLGAAPEVILVPVRAIPCTGRGSNENVIAGLNWILTDPGYKMVPGLIAGTQVFPGRVVNMSFISTVLGAKPNPLEQAIDKLIAQGITVVAAAGNQRDDVNNYSPARHAPPIIVAGSTGVDPADRDGRWINGPTGNLGSNYGGTVDIFAPADLVLVARTATTTSVSTGETNATASGTSFAAPLVAGAAARFLEMFPTETNSQIETRIISNATTKAPDATEPLMLNLGAGSPDRLLYIPYDCKRRSAGS